MMKELLSNSGLMAVIGIIAGGIGRDVLNKWLNKPSELRIEIEGLKKELIRQNEEIEKWKGRFYYLLDAAIREDKEALRALLQEHIGVTKEE